MPKHKLLIEYDKLREQAQKALYSPDNTKTLDSIYRQSQKVIGKLSQVQLKSQVTGKEYFAFKKGTKMSRAINKALYEPEYENWELLQKAMQGNNLQDVTRELITKTLYTMAISFCAAIDILKSGDQKTPGTFFEYFVAYFFAWRVGVEPTTSIQVLSVDGEDTKLRTDFIFNLGEKKRKFHMPIKTSTRERSIMLWAHQRLLDGVYGVERFLGTPVLLTETKTDKKKTDVVEICLPEQWRVYQLYIAKLKRVYYLDLPEAYIRLNLEFPPLNVRPFADFFYEWDELSPS